MNPRVSRSSALASKATGFPIAKVAARLAVGYTLDELPNEITGVTPASFEPTLDYVAVKVPRFAFEKLPGADTELTTHMKSVGEVLALGRTFGRGLRQGHGRRGSSTCRPRTPADVDEALAIAAHALVGPLRPHPVGARRGASSVGGARTRPPASTRGSCGELAALAAARAAVRGPLDALDARRAARRAPRGPQPTATSPTATGADEPGSGRRRRALGRASHATTRSTPARAEFAALTPYYYSAFETEGELARDDRPGDRGAGLRPQPHRPGDRVRLLLRPRGPDGARAGLRGGDGQLQPGDGLHRPRRQRPPLPRAGDASTPCSTSARPSSRWG